MSAAAITLEIFCFFNNSAIFAIEVVLPSGPDLAAAQMVDDRDDRIHGVLTQARVQPGKRGMIELVLQQDIGLKRTQTPV